MYLCSLFLVCAERLFLLGLSSGCFGEGFVVIDVVVSYNVRMLLLFCGVGIVMTVGSLGRCGSETSGGRSVLPA